jgi:hypothetical protein
MENVFRNRLVSAATHLPIRFLETAHMSQYFPSLNLFIPLPYFQEKRGVWYCTASVCVPVRVFHPLINFEPTDELAWHERFPFEGQSTVVPFYSLPSITPTLRALDFF